MSNQKRKWKGSVTVETCLVLQLFLIFTIQVYSLFEILTLYTRLQAACEETAVEAATILALPEESRQTEVVSFLLSETLVREEILRKANLKDSADSLIVGGLAGLHLFRSDLATDGEHIEIILTYRVKPRFSTGILGKLTLVNHSRVRAWTGFEREAEDEDTAKQGEKVYVTATGSAYHLYSDCTYLKADVKSVRGDELKTRRNEDGEIYYACEFCAKNREAAAEETYYITPWGTRFHTDRECKALEKKIQTIAIEDVGNRHLCGKCEKRHNNS